MSGFRKAKAEQAALKIALYGPPGSGKTFTTLLLAEGLAARDGKRIAYVDTERGTDFYCKQVSERPVHPEEFDFDAIYTRSLMEVIREVKALDPAQYAVIVIDSITHLWEAARAAYAGKQTKIGTIPMQAWGGIKKPYKDLLSILLSSPMHAFVLGRQGTDYATDEETDELKAIGFKMKAEGETAYEPHILLRMEAVKAKRTNALATIVAYAEKDRTGVLSGRSFADPTFESICGPLLGLLGGRQAQMKSPDETASDDAEAIERAEHAMAAQSEELLRTFSARIELCDSADALKKIGAGITPALKAKMLPADLAAVREKYHRRMSALPDAAKIVEGFSQHHAKMAESGAAHRTMMAGANGEPPHDPDTGEIITDEMARAANVKSYSSETTEEQIKSDPKWKIDPTGREAAKELAMQLEERAAAANAKTAAAAANMDTPLDIGTKRLLDDGRKVASKGSREFQIWHRRLNQKQADQVEPYLEELRAEAAAADARKESA